MTSYNFVNISVLPRQFLYDFVLFCLIVVNAGENNNKNAIKVYDWKCTESCTALGSRISIEVLAQAHYKCNIY